MLEKRITIEIVDVSEERVPEQQKHQCIFCDGTIRPSELESIEDVRAWLSCPRNHHSSQLYMVKWEGYIPTIGSSFVDRLEEDGFAHVILKEHMKRRGDPRFITQDEEVFE